MEYNTSLPRLIIPEYGRNIQRMIDYAISIEDREKRNVAANAIIQVMGQLNPHLRDFADFKHKLWDHIFIISDFKLDVDSPYPRPTAETFKTKPELVKYPVGKIKYKHYGKITEKLIDKASEFPEGKEKDMLAEIIANLLKRSYLNWNRDTVNDQMILDQLEELSKGKLKLKDISLLKHTYDLLPRGSEQARDNKEHYRERRGGDRDGSKRRGFHKGGGGKSQHRRSH
jgi:hypothetical protein